MEIAVINGPNLNLLGQRDRAVYGNETLEDVINLLRFSFPEIEIKDFQSNSEGEIIDFIQAILNDAGIRGLIINPGAYAHYSYAIADALRDLKGCKPAVEVHISNIHAREEFRSRSVTAPCVDAVIAGAGIYGYILAAQHLLHLTSNK